MARGIPLLLVGGCLGAAGCARSVQPAFAAQAAVPAGGGHSALAVSATSPCVDGDLSLSFDSRDGDFTGMSHDGALLMLRNTGKQTCTIPLRPSLQFTDLTGKPLPLHAHVPPGMHPGPVLVPLKLLPGASAQGQMRWVTGPVYDTNTCIDVARASLTIPGGDLGVPFKAHVCGQSPQSLEYEQELMQPAGPPVAPDSAR